MSFKAVSTESYQIAETQHQEKIYGLKLYPNYTKTTRH